jgi:hypothetical protein
VSRQRYRGPSHAGSVPVAPVPIIMPTRRAGLGPVLHNLNMVDSEGERTRPSEGVSLGTRPNPP